MSTDRDRESDTALEALFTAAQERAPTASDDFLARLGADAMAAVPRPALPPVKTRRRPVLTRFASLFAASGLSGAAALGVWIGFVMPDILTDTLFLTDEAAGVSTFLPGTDLSLLTE